MFRILKKSSKLFLILKKWFPATEAGQTSDVSPAKIAAENATNTAEFFEWFTIKVIIIIYNINFGYHEKIL